MVGKSALSVTAKALRSLLTKNVGLPEDQILIGHPMEAASTGSADTTGKQYLNLFFYQVEYSGYPSDAASDDPFYIRLHCLVTALGANETIRSNVVTAGENDLRLVGSVMQTMHENPEIRIKGSYRKEIGQLQVVPIKLTLDDINHIWSTQGDTPYRLSVGYEIALLPMPLTERVEKAQKVGSIGTLIGADENKRQEAFDGESSASGVPDIRVDTTLEGWAPHICFVQDGQCTYSLNFNAGSKEQRKFRPVVWTAGEKGEKVSLYWERWYSDGKGWHLFTNRRKVVRRKTVTIKHQEVNPDQAANMPASAFDKFLNPIYWRRKSSSQAVLYAVRTYKRKSDGVEVEVRSNPLLLIVSKVTK